MKTESQKTRTRRSTANQNGEVKEKLTEEAKGTTVSPASDKEQASPESGKAKPVNLDDRIEKFEKLKGLTTNRERLVQTLSELNKFKHNQGDSSSFHLKDSHGLEFKTSNTNLVELVTSQLQTTLQERKSEIEDEIIKFEL